VKARREHLHPARPIILLWIVHSSILRYAMKNTELSLQDFVQLAVAVH